jgi:hypothetical protein
MEGGLSHSLTLLFLLLDLLVVLAYLIEKIVDIVYQQRPLETLSPGG